jgi:hypothetical protein
MEQASADSQRRLRIAVWCLSGLLALAIGALLWQKVQARLDLLATSSAIPVDTLVSSGETDNPQDSELTPSAIGRSIERASVILLTRYSGDPEHRRSVISEILKMGPDIQFNYGVGDQYTGFDAPSEPPCHHCDGELIFLNGNPPFMHLAFTYEGDRIGTIGGLPIAELRRLIAHAPTPLPTRTPAPNHTRRAA